MKSPTAPGDLLHARIQRIRCTVPDAFVSQRIGQRSRNLNTQRITKCNQRIRAIAERIFKLLNCRLTSLIQFWISLLQSVRHSGNNQSRHHHGLLIGDFRSILKTIDDRLIQCNAGLAEMAFILCQHAVNIELLEGQIRRNLFEQSTLLFTEIFGDELAAPSSSRLRHW